MNPSEACIGILTCPKHNRRLAKFLATYKSEFKRRGLQYYVLMANPDLDSEYKITGSTFEMRCQEAYEVLAHKMVLFYDYIYTQTTFK